ncbi:DUF4232 domain-containing protein [Streptomyces sp. NPDC047928]|uniref:DUF4232 domain-containing protein n=1 Tax=unclassified Streptomyces TaxID=2593676 RepID=UPI0037109C5B
MRTRGSGALAGRVWVAGVLLSLTAVGCGGTGTGTGTGAAAGSGGTGAPAPPVASPSAAPPAASSACPPSGVRVATGPVEAAMGLRAMGVTLTNCGTRPFEVSGYPDVAVLDEEREKLDVSVRLGTNSVDGTARRSTFTLRPGERARASLLWRNTVTRADIVATSGAYLTVVPAPGAAAQTVAPSDGPLDLGNTDAVEVTPWAPGQG